MMTGNGVVAVVLGTNFLVEPIDKIQPFCWHSRLNRAFPALCNPLSENAQVEKGQNQTQLVIVVFAIDQAQNGQYDCIQVFVKNKAEIDALFPALVAALKPESLLWISYPKRTSGIQTDLSRDTGWDSMRGLKWINLVSVNTTWSAFSLRLPKPGEDLRVRGS